LRPARLQVPPRNGPVTGDARSKRARRIIHASAPATGFRTRGPARPTPSGGTRAAARRREPGFTHIFKFQRPDLKQIFWSPPYPRQRASPECISEGGGGGQAIAILFGAQYSSERKSQYSSERKSQYSSERKSQYSSVRKSQYSSERKSQYSSERKSQYSSECKSQYSSERYILRNLFGALYSSERKTQNAKADPHDRYLRQEPATSSAAQLRRRSSTAQPRKRSSSARH
jgi:hypothetical protein